MRTLCTKNRNPRQLKHVCLKGLFCKYSAAGGRSLPGPAEIILSNKTPVQKRHWGVPDPAEGDVLPAKGTAGTLAKLHICGRGNGELQEEQHNLTEFSPWNGAESTRRAKT